MCSVKKGQEIDIPVLGVNLDKSLWGEDAMEFKYVLIHISLRRLFLSQTGALGLSAKGYWGNSR